jgi:hypothetical protein
MVEIRSIGTRPDRVEISEGVCEKLCSLKLLSVRISVCKSETRLADISRLVVFKILLRELEIK